MANDLYAVIGHPIAHSLSPRIHAEFARHTGQDLRYEARLAPLNGFAATVEQFWREGGRGLNVTVPFKAEAWRLRVRLTLHAQAAGAVNTLARTVDGVLGYNTDGLGLIRDLEDNLGVALAGCRVLIVGAGGAAAGICLPLLEARPERVVIANRTPARAEALAERYMASGPVAAARAETLKGAAFDLVINATAASLQGELPALPAGVFAPGALAYDLMYGAKAVPFLDHARRLGAARSADGLGMLVEQAAESFYLWRGVRPPTRPVLEWLRQP